MTRAVLLDMLGTLVRLADPVPRLRAELVRVAGADPGEAAAARGFGAEIAYYLEHHTEARDDRSLDGLRDRCAAVLREALGLEDVDQALVREAMLASLEFTPFPDALEALPRLRRMGLRLVVASNWDCSLPDWLGETGLGGLVDGAASSATAGARKPARPVFDAALRIAGVRAQEALHVGDSLENDVEGARAAGLRAVLLSRDGEPPPGVEAVRSLAELPRLL